MFDKILVVCVGNICRSPVGEYLLKARLPARDIASAGVGALVGHPADAQALAAAAPYGIDLTPHQARQLTDEMCRCYDLILVMERKLIEAVCAVAPAARSKTMLFGQWLAQGDKDIADPYRQSDDVFRITCQRLAQAADLWANKLKKS